EAGRVELLLVLGGNPVFTAPADVPFAAALARVPLSVHLGLYHDETAALCHWHVPEAHPLEAWSDVRAFDGTVTIVQPLIAPLYGGKSAHELLAALGEPPDRSGYDLVRQQWQARRHGGDFEQAWRRWLHDGVVPGTALPPEAVVAAKAIPQPPAGAPAGHGDGLRRLPAPLRRRARLHRRARGPPDGRAPSARRHAAPPAHGGARHRARDHARALPPREARAPGAGGDALSARPLPRPPLGHGDRPLRLRRLQRLRR